MSTPPPPSSESGRPDRDEQVFAQEIDDPTGVRALLASLPAPGPMPADLVARINASIAAEQAARAGATGVGIHDRRRVRWQRLGLAAAAAVIAAVALPALLSTGPTSWLASLSSSHSAGSGSVGSMASLRAPDTAGASTTGAAAGSVAAPRIYASGTAYRAGAFAPQVRAFLAHPGTPLAPLAAEAPGIGPAGTARGLAPCLTRLRLDPAAQVSADVATFDGQAAVVVVVHTATAQIAYAMDRRCTSGGGSVLAGPLHVG